MATQNEKTAAVSAIIETGGKQFRVVPGQTIAVEKIEGTVGSKITFDRVLFIHENADLKSGADLKDQKVVGEILEQGKGPKIRVFTYKSKKRQRRTLGHRQPLTKVKILEIGAVKANKAPAKTTAKKSA